MQPIPTPITKVTIHLYEGDAIAEEVVWTNGSGTYSVGTLATKVFYNVELDGGEAVNGGPVVGKRYVATYTDSSGQRGQTPWMHCLRAGSNPSFGRTESLIGASDAAQSSDIAYLIELEDATVRAAVPKVEPLELIYIEGAEVRAEYTGPLNAQWTVGARGGKRTNSLKVGDKVVITGKNKATGNTQSIPAVLQTISVEDDAAGFRS